jgi:thymidylate synthase (FAD)
MIDDHINVLDHGFIRVVDYMGNDAAIVQAARVSYGKGTKSVSEDRGLIRYLMRNGHTSPFEMCEIKLHCKMPIFVARQWVRHRTASLNEYSARYSEVPDEFYIPEPEQVRAQSKANKQGRDEELQSSLVDQFITDVDTTSNGQYDVYEQYITEGVARELARIVLPLNTYTEWYWKIDLHNLLHFLELRCDKHAQWEIRAYANAILAIVKNWVPLTYEAFIDYRLDGSRLSRLELAYIRHLLSDKILRYTTEQAMGFSKREWNEFLEKLSL